MIVQFWTFANEVFNAREAKRLFALVGGGGVVATIFVGVGVGLNAKLLGLANLLYVSIGILAACVFFLFLAKRAAPTPDTSRGVLPKTRKAPEAAFSSRYLKLIAATTVCTFLATTLGDYEFKLIVSEAIQDRDARAAYFGTFYGVTGLLSAVVQFFLTSRILEKAGILPALVMLPVSLLGGAAAVFAAPVLAAASALKGAENTLRYTINDATTQLLYLPIAKEARARAKAFIDGILRPLAVATAGGALFLGSHVMTHRTVTSALATVCVLWGVLIVVLRSEYLKTLLTTLKQRRLDFEGVAYGKTDEGTLRAFSETLKTGSPEEIITVLDLLSATELPPGQMDAMVLPL
jgi:AAA family ATP:ADP antiporter